MPRFYHTGGTSVHRNPPFSVTIVSRDPLSSLADKGAGVTYSHSASCWPPQSCTWSFESSASTQSLIHVRKQRDDRELRELNRLWVEVHATMMEVNQKLNNRHSEMFYIFMCKHKTKITAWYLIARCHRTPLLSETAQNMKTCRGNDAFLSWKHTHTLK